jgi:hypothetical protein
MGAAGDMLMSALLELHPEPESFMARLNSAGIPNVRIIRETAKRCGITGTHINVSVNGVTEDELMYGHSHSHEHGHSHEHSHAHEHSHTHCHRSLRDIGEIIAHLDVKDSVKGSAIEVYRLIAEAESKAHNCELDNIHFHEVGTMDAIADIVGVCMLIDELRVDKILVSPINVGKGEVRCAHGILPVPAPATAYILRDVPIYSNEVSVELCTPTGAALLKHFASKFTHMPAMKVSRIGYGLGTKELECANCVRAFLGEMEDSSDRIAELICNIDDMTGERIGFATERLLEGGALDVFTTPIGMKKSRPAVLLTCICREDKREEIIRLIFKHTTTIGVRENIMRRYILDREERVEHTKYGDVRVKRSSGYGVSRAKAEYSDLTKIANEKHISIAELEAELSLEEN